MMLQEALRKSDLVLAVAAAKANYVQPDRPRQLCDALRHAIHRHHHSRDGVDLLLGNRAPRRRAARVEVQVGLLGCPPRPLSSIVNSLLSLSASYSGVSQQFGEKSCARCRRSLICSPIGLGSIRSSGTDCGCMIVVRVGGRRPKLHIAKRAL